MSPRHYRATSRASHPRIEIRRLNKRPSLLEQKTTEKAHTVSESRVFCFNNDGLLYVLSYSSYILSIGPRTRPIRSLRLFLPRKGRSEWIGCVRFSFSTHLRVEKENQPAQQKFEYSKAFEGEKKRHLFRPKRAQTNVCFYKALMKADKSRSGSHFPWVYPSEWQIRSGAGGGRINESRNREKHQI